ncbi:MAG: formyltransferase family protein [Bacteroidota bacterium]|nr:formyltransferase family protein [Bacteroidota bacterium]
MTRINLASDILFIGKKDDYFSKVAADYLKENIPSAIIVYSAKSDPIPDIVKDWKGDYLISYLSQWIIPASILANAKEGGINLHPGSPDYPGIGCTNFAIYNQAKEFGITCHYMEAKVDTGAIIKVSRFPIHKNDTVYSLTQRCYANILNVFFELVDDFLKGVKPGLSQEQWKRTPYTRKELNELCVLTTEMDEEEINRRIAATTFGDKAWAYFQLNGQNFYLNLND